MLKQYFQMESAIRRRERRNKKKREQVENWRLQLEIEGSFDSYEDNQYYVLLKAMQLNSVLKDSDSVKEDEIRQLEQENLALKRMNLALASSNGPREELIRRLRTQIEELKREKRILEGEKRDLRGQIWPEDRLEKIGLSLKQTNTPANKEREYSSFT